MDENGTELQSSEVEYGQTPAYIGETPTKAADAQYTYTFAGWTPEIVAVTGAATYTATYSSTVNKYLIRFVNDDEEETLLWSAEFEYGTTPVYGGETPTKPATGEFTYTFSGWTPALAPVTGPATYKAKYNDTTNTYTIIWQNYDGTVLETDENVEYGQMPSYDGETPTREASAQYTYTFTGWNPAVTAVTGNATYIAVFAETVNQYTVTFVDYDDTVISSAEYAYGTAADDIVKPADPTREADAQYTYTFAGWNPALAAVTGNATYKATYTETLNQYTITWKMDDGSVIDTTTVAYGTVPTHADPSKAATAEYTYTFTGWTPEVVAVTGDAEYTATFRATKNSYTITWLNDDGSLIDTTTVEYGTVPTHADAAKTADAQYTYTFAGWTPEVVAVVGDATYTATYTTTLNKYTITFVDEDGTELQSSEVAYGETPVYTGETPTKAATAQYTYTFAGWDPTIAAVTGTQTYTATYEATVNTYTVTFKNWDGETLQSGEYAYGATPAYSGETPVKPATSQYTYTFTGWDPEIAEVTADATYTAVYTATVNKYTITWIIDGVEETEEYEYGATPAHVDPEKEADAQYTYTFTGWDPEVTAVTGNATYTAVFEATLNKYTVKFVDYDGTLLSSAEYDYGTAADDIVKPGDPTRAADAQYTYTFAGWDPEIASVTEDATYTATYSTVLRTYTVTFLDENGTVISTIMVDAGSKVTEPTEQPIMNSPAAGAYQFAGWYLDGVPYDFNQAVEANLTLVATWKLKMKLSVSVTLKDNLDVNLKASNIAEEDASHYTIKWTFERTPDESLTGEVNLGTVTRNDGIYKVVLASIFAYQMTRPFEINTYYDGVLIKNSVFSVQKYLETLINTETVDENTKTVCRKALDYGANAQLFLDGRTYYDENGNQQPHYGDVENLANRNTNPNNTITAAKPSNTAKKTGSITGMSKMSASLILGTETSIKIYFTYTGDIGQLSFSCDNGKTPTAPVAESGENRYSVKVAGIRSFELYKDYTVTITAGTETVSVTYSAYAYAASYWNSSDAKLSRLVKALVAYGEAARAVWSR